VSDRVATYNYAHTKTLSHKPELTNQLGQFLFMRQGCSVRHTVAYSNLTELRFYILPDTK